MWFVQKIKIKNEIESNILEFTFKIKLIFIAIFRSSILATVKVAFRLLTLKCYCPIYFIMSHMSHFWKIAKKGY